MTYFRTITLFTVLAAMAAGTGAQVDTQKRRAPPRYDYLRQLEASELAVDLNGPPLNWDAKTPEERQIVGKRWSAMQKLGTDRSLAGDMDGALNLFDSGHSQPLGLPPAPGLLDAVIAEDAVAAIVREAKTHQVVILNEAHHVPMHRAFAARLASELRKLGFDYLACEAFSNRTVSAPMANGFVTQMTGSYTNEPAYGQFLREAHRDGWKLVAYESTVRSESTVLREQVRVREQAQAENLVKAIFSKDPKAKVFIYVGYGHVVESPIPTPDGDVEWMAAQLKRMTGIDPLTIDQTNMFSHPNRNAESPAYRQAIEKFPASQPFVLRRPDNSFVVNNMSKAAVDMQVIFPDYGSEGGRAAWLRTLAAREPRDIPADLLPTAGRRMIVARSASEPGDAVPVDIVLVEAGKPVPKFMLPRGDYLFEIEK